MKVRAEMTVLYRKVWEPGHRPNREERVGELIRRFQPEPRVLMKLR